jgi:hypothetical protein
MSMLVQLHGYFQLSAHQKIKTKTYDVMIILSLLCFQNLVCDNLVHYVKVRLVLK